jgi:hypothetical protein
MGGTLFVSMRSRWEVSLVVLRVMYLESCEKLSLFHGACYNPLTAIRQENYIPRRVLTI